MARLFFALFALLLMQEINAQKIQDVEFHNGKLKLAGTLFIPSTPGPHPAVAVTHGSGKEGRSDAGYISLANALAKEGYEVLIYDKRGVGQSDGVYKEVPDMSLPAGDLNEAVRFLQSRPEVDKNRIGVYGHSQGAWVAPLAAASSGNIAFIMALCGGGICIREQALYSYRAEFTAKRYSKETTDSIISFARQLYIYLGSGVGYTAANSAYINAAQMPWFEFFQRMGFGAQLPPPGMLKEPVFNFFKAINYDPQAALLELNIPTLVILAADDDRIPSEKVKQLWEDAFSAGGHKDKLSVVILPGEDHYDFVTENGKVIYKPVFRDALLSWLKENIN